MRHWDDLRFLLATSRAGSMAAAGRALGADQTTVSRRVAAVERALGMAVFRRDGTRLAVTRPGKLVLDRAELIEREIGLIKRMAAEAEGQLAGSVRIIAPVSLATRFLAPHLPELCRTYPRIGIELLCDMNVFNASRVETEVGLRVSHALPDHLDMRAVSDFAFGLYANPEAMCDNGLPLDIGSLRRNPFIGYTEEFAELPEERWIVEIFGAARPALRTNTTIGLVAATEAGVGIAALPCYVGDQSPLLRRLPDQPLLRTERLWLVTLREFRRVARVRAVVDLIARLIRRNRPLLSGQGICCMESIGPSSPLSRSPAGD